MAATQTAQNAAALARKGIQEGKLGTALSSFAQSTTTQVSTAVSSFASSETGSIALKSLFYGLMWLFVFFVILVLIHNFVTPVFSFAPGKPGYIPIPGGATDSQLWWNTTLPHQDDYHPRAGDKMVGNALKSNFSMSLDVYLPSITQVQPTKRVLFFKTARDKTNSTASFWQGWPTDLGNSTAAELSTNFYTRLTDSSRKVSMIGYLSEKNELLIDFYLQGGQKLTLGPFANVPVGKPFRITLVVHSRILELYINGRLAKSLNVPTSALTSPVAGNEAIYPAPQEFRGMNIKLLNLQLWPRPIYAGEVKAISPYLPSRETFDAMTTIGAASTNATAVTPESSNTSGRTLLPGFFVRLSWAEATVFITALLVAAYIFRPSSSSS
jgi:hypothetical protein